RVSDKCPHIDATPAFNGIEVLRNGLPGKIHSGPLRPQRYPLHIVEHAEVPIPVSRPYRCNHRAALAHNDGGIAVQRGGVDDGVPHGLGIKVRMMIDKPWSNDAAISIDGLSGRVVTLAYPDDFPLVHRDIGVKGGLA